MIACYVDWMLNEPVSSVDTQPAQRGSTPRFPSR